MVSERRLATGVIFVLVVIRTSVCTFLPRASGHLD